MTISSERAAADIAADASRATFAQDRDTVLLKRVGWGAVIAGIVVTLVAQVLLNMLGIGIGLSAFSVGAADNPAPESFPIAAALWWIISGILAAFIGGLVAGRLSGRPERSTGGWHGVITWAATTLIVLWAVTASIGGLLGSAFSALGGTTAGIGAAAGGSAALIEGGDPFSGIRQDVQRATGVNDPKALSASVMHYLRSTTSEDPAAAQAARQRAVDDLARATNITPEEANARLANWETQYRQAAAQAKQAAEATRKVVAQASLYGFAALLLGALAGWLGGAAGAPVRRVTVVVAPPGAYVP